MLGIKRIFTGVSITPFRSFRTLTAPLPTVYEPLPRKRNGESVLSYLQKELLSKYDPTGKRRALVNRENGLRSGDIIRVTYLDRTEVIGKIIAIKRGHNTVGSSILLRNKLKNIGVEIRVPLYLPKLKNIEKIESPAKYLPGSKQYWIRNTRHDVQDLEDHLRRKEKKRAEAAAEAEAPVESKGKSGVRSGANTRTR